MNRSIRYIIFTCCFLFAYTIHAQVTVPKRDIQAVDSLNRTKPIAPLTVEKNGYTLNSWEDGKYYHRKTIPYWQDSLGVTLLDTTYIDGGTLIMVTMAGDSLIYGAVNDSIEFEGDTVCIIDMGEEYCVSIDSIFFTDTSLCYIILPDTMCVEWSNTGINIYVSDGSLTGTRTLTQNGFSLTWEGSTAGRTRWSGTNASPGEYMELSHTNVSPHRALLSLQHRTSGTSNDAFMRYGVSGSGGAYPYFSTGLDRSERAFAISDSNTLGLNHLLRIYSPVGTDNDSVVIYRNTSIYPGLGINRRPQKALDVIGMMNLKSTTALQDVFINGGNSTASGGSNVVIGINTTGDALTSGSSNVIIGPGVGGSLTTGAGNTIIGNSLAGNALTSGGNNVILGVSSGGLFNGSNSFLWGFNAGGTAGAYNISMGYLAGNGGQRDSCIYLGYRAGHQSIGGARNNNVFVGTQAGESAAASNSIMIGTRAGYNWGFSNTLIIENSSSTTPLVFGSFSQDTFRINGLFRALHIRYETDIDAANDTITLAYTSVNQQVMKASGAKVIILPDALTTGSTYRVGTWFYIVNNSSSGAITVTSADPTNDVIAGDLTIDPQESGTWVLSDHNFWSKK
jgi:hypothetical protein